MEWIAVVLTGLVVLVLLVPILLFFLLVPLALLAPHPEMGATTSFTCPFSRRRATATFLVSPESGHPTDVLRCSLFAQGRLLCTKGCLERASGSWGPSSMIPRFALLAGDTVYRDGVPAEDGTAARPAA